MKAAVYHRYGPPEVVRIAEVPRPAVGPRDVLVRVHATTVTAGDWRMRSADVPPGFGPFVRLGFGITGPRQPILGTDFAGVVEAVGADVTRFAVGDQVFGAGSRTHAEYVAIAQDKGIAPLPAGLSFAEAAALPFGGITALYFLQERSRVAAGERVLVIGASGGVGVAAVQLARHAGGRVVGVCSAANAQLVTSLGAERVIDYARQDFTALPETWDVIVDTVGNHPFARCQHVLAPGGRLLLVAAGFGQLLGALLRPRRGDRRLVAGVASASSASVHALKDLAESGAIKPVVDRTLPFERIVEAHALVDSRRKRGSVVVTLS